MSYAYYHRKRELRYIGCKVVVVECSKIARCSAATDYHHTIPLILFGCYRFKGCDYGVRRACPLHQCRKEPDTKIKTRRRRVQLMYEVAIPRGTGSGDHCDPQWYISPFHLSVEVDDPFGTQTIYDLQPSAHKIPESIGWIYVGDIGRKSVGGMKGCGDTHHHLHTALKPLTCGFGEFHVYLSECAAPYSAAQTRHRITRHRMLLHKLKITVSGAAHIGSLGDHPYPRKSGSTVDSSGYARGELLKSNG